MENIDIAVLLTNLIPAMIVLYFLFKGWLKGGLYMLIYVVQLVGSYFLTSYLSRLLTNYLVANPDVHNYFTNFITNNSDLLNKLPGSSKLFLGSIIQNNVESITWYFLFLLCFIVIFIFLMIAFTLILRLAINFNKIPILGFINKFIGAIEGLAFGVAFTLIAIYIICFFLDLLGYNEIETTLMSSWLPLLFRSLI